MTQPWQCVVKSPDAKGRMKVRASWTYGTKEDAERQAGHAKRDAPAGMTIEVRPLPGNST